MSKPSAKRVCKRFSASDVDSGLNIFTLALYREGWLKLSRAMEVLTLPIRPGHKKHHKTCKESKEDAECTFFAEYGKPFKLRKLLEPAKLYEPFIDESVYATSVGVCGRRNPRP